MPKVEKTKKKIRSRVRKIRYKVTTAGEKKMASRAAKRRESGGTIIKVFEENRHRRKRTSKGKRFGMGAEK